jgi:hypothetical protein
MGKNQNTWSHSTKIIFGEIKIIFHPSEAWVNTFSYFLNPHAMNVLLYRMKPRKHIHVKYRWQTNFKSIGTLSQSDIQKPHTLQIVTVAQYLMAVCSVYILVNWTKLRSPYIWLTNIKCHIFRKKPTYWDWGIFWIRFDAWNKYRWTITQTSWIIIYIYIYIP